MTDGVTGCCRAAKSAAPDIHYMTTERKNEALRLAAAALTENRREILAANALDLKANAEKPAHLIDRLALDEKRIADMADGLKKLIGLPDPVGETVESWQTENGLKIRKVRVPLGVLGIIYEARPNVTADAIGLCIKSGNAVVLRGSKDAIRSNRAVTGAVKARLEQNGYNPEFIQLVEDTTHEGVETLMKCREYLDVLIPRGSAALIRTVVENSTVPVIETGSGNCHAYVEKTGKLSYALPIILNGKLQRPSVCNALESLLIDEAVAGAYLPQILSALKEKGVLIFGCEKTRKICPFVLPASEADYGTEYLDLKISCKIVDGTEEAIDHINRYGTGHSEVIITQDPAKAELFLSRVDSAAVYVNASTRFTDGFEFGFGAEMGISTQKLHARGPMGLRQLTGEKYEIVGEGQIRR